MREINGRKTTEREREREIKKERIARGGNARAYVCVKERVGDSREVLALSRLVPTPRTRGVCMCRVREDVCSMGTVRRVRGKTREEGDRKRRRKIAGAPSGRPPIEGNELGLVPGPATYILARAGK